jgi:hypothetical protein
LAEYQINQLKQIYPKKSMFSTHKCKRAKNSYGGYPTKFADSTQNPKKNNRNTKFTNQNENFPKKNYVSYLKSVNQPKIRMEATRRNLQAQPKILKKIIGTPNVPIKTKICPKNECLVP